MKIFGFLISLATISISQGGYKLTPLKGNIFKEEIGKAHLYHEKWRLMININDTNMQERLDIILQTLKLSVKICNSQCAEENKLN